GHRSASICHLGNIAMLTGRKLRWDPAQEDFVNDAQANRMLSRPMRSPWRL
ncbi:MAG: Gfo/Idh/MocA family protein, partial [Planctomycetota bacterium]